MERALMCPQCNAPLKPSRFAQSVTCSYCGAMIKLDESTVSAEMFHEAFRQWNSPESYQVSAWISIGDSHWTLDQNIAHGDISDVYTGMRARWPTELAILKLLRDRNDSELFDNEWNALQVLHRSNVQGSDGFTALIPQPIVHGDVSHGPYAGKRVSLFRWISGFRNSFDDVIRTYPQGIPPRASIWIWRRILEVLSFIHASGMVHGAVLPSHLLIQENEHGVRLVGYCVCDRIDGKIRIISPGSEPYYPESTRSGLKLTTQLDLAMSARCIAAVLGGDPANLWLPNTVPAPLASIVRRIALTDTTGTYREDAWSIREELGKIAEQVFGPPQFIPIVMPS